MKDNIDNINKVSALKPLFNVLGVFLAYAWDTLKKHKDPILAGSIGLAFAFLLFSYL